MAYLIMVGQKYPGWSGKKEEGGQFTTNLDGPLFSLYYNKPSKEESVNFRMKPMKFGLVKGGDHTFFFLFNIEGVTQGWSDASYTISLVHPDDRSNKDRADNLGWLCKMLLIDAADGTVASMRASTFTPQFSAILDKLIAEQKALIGSYTKQKHDAEIAQAYVKWKTPNDMIKDALIVEVPGQKFHHDKQDKPPLVS